MIDYNEYRANQLIDMMAAMPDKYMHLKIFQNRSIDKSSNQNGIFLMVTPDSFGKVQLLDLNYENDAILLHLKDLQTNLDGNVQIDINTEKQTVFFVNWSDVEEMVIKHKNNNISNSSLLDFDY